MHPPPLTSGASGHVNRNDSNLNVDALGKLAINFVLPLTLYALRRQTAAQLEASKVSMRTQLHVAPACPCGTGLRTQACCALIQAFIHTGLHLRGCIHLCTPCDHRPVISTPPCERLAGESLARATVDTSSSTRSPASAARSSIGSCDESRSGEGADDHDGSWGRGNIRRCRG